MSTLSSTPLKRKLSMSSERPEVVITTKPPKKKVKTTTAEVVLVTTKKKSAPSKKPKAAPKEKPLATSEEFPDGYVYCHQCNKKRTPDSKCRHDKIVLLREAYLCHS